MTTMDKLNGKLIDLHAHILPGLDDGASDIDEALAMARQAVERQIHVVAATPHFIDLTWDHVKNEAAKLGELLAAHHVDLTVVPGAELFIDLDLTGLAKEEIPTYNDAGKYCLIEFPMMELPPYVDQVLFALQVKGITPIIAHPERYRYVIDDPNLAASWIETGCLIQLNTNSILGGFGLQVQRTAEIMLRRQMVHVIASDAHSTGRRGFHLDRAAEAVGRLMGVEMVEQLLCANPARIIAGEAVDVPEVVQHRPQRRFWDLIRRRRSLE